MTAALNFFRASDTFRRLKIGGRTINAALKSINGNRLEADWNVQRSTDSNHAIAVFRGKKLIEGVTLTLACGDGGGSTSAADFDDIRELFAMMLPKIVNGKPATLTIENPILNYIGLTKFNFKSWQEGPTDTLGWEVEIGIIQDAPPSPAKTGAQDPAKSSNGATGGADPQITALQKARDQIAAEAAAI
jgi:hypothetical protein